jgi:hypothetical protein
MSSDAWYMLRSKLKDRLRDARDRLNRLDLSEGAKRKLGRAALVVVPIVLVVGVVVGYFVLRPTPKPDYMFDDMDTIFDYTLVEDSFNDLPVRERIELVGQLGRRLESMSQSDSAMVAAFAAGIAGSARDQLEKNFSRLMIDAFDMFATEYDDVQPEERGDFIEHMAVEMHKLGDTLEGKTRDMTDEQRLAEVFRQAERDEKMLKNPRNRPNDAQFGRMFKFVFRGVGSYATPQQRARGAQLMRDMVRHLRGRDISTGKGPG